MAARLKVAFLTLYPVETASTRQRIHKNIRFFPDDIQATIYCGITQESLRRLARRGSGPLARMLFLAEELTRKLWHLWRARKADVVVVQKGLTAMNIRGFPTLLFALGRPVVFDFDDAVHLEPPQAFRSAALRWLVAPRQVLELFPRCATVIAGNAHLAAAAGDAQTRVIATPMDTDWYQVGPLRSSGPIEIGWSGSSTTNHYVDRLAPILRRAAEQIPGLGFRVISNDDRGIHWERFAGVRTQFVPWSLDRLVEDLHGLDIGLMPLIEDEWSRSKCGGKILQYMACGIPSIASPVGINTEVVEEGVTGFLADEDDVWVERIVQLAKAPGLRRQMGDAARSRIERAYSNRVTSPLLAGVLRDVSRHSL